MGRKSNRAAIHYVNNKDFSQAVMDYVMECNRCKENDKEVPIVPNYIADCFLRIAEGLSHRPNFIRYTYREEMVMDAVENCLKAISNYNIEAATRTGLPNAFAYFTQITHYAFLRRIEKEKKQQDVKERYLNQAGVEAFISTGGSTDNNVVQHFVDELRDRIDKVKERDTEIKELVQEDKKKKREAKKVSKKKVLIDPNDSDLNDFFED